MSADTPARVFRFGVFEADEATGELRKQGVRLKLNTQPFKVLVLLLERPSEIVSREEMRLRLWGADTFVDFDHGLNSAVNKIRDALSDSASAPRYIETVSGKGYRFVAPVASALPAQADAPAALPSAAAVSYVLTTTEELPAASRKVVRVLLLGVQAMYLAFYLGALGNLTEIGEIFVETNIPSPAALMAVLVITAAILIPVRLFIVVAVALDFENLPSKFSRMFPVLLILDLAWAVSPFLLIHHISGGLALGLSAPLVYLPFAQRSLVLMYARERASE